MGNIVPSSYMYKLSPRILEVSTDGIILFNIKTLKILDVNSSASRIFGYKKYELLKMDVLNLHPVENRECIKRILDNLSSSEMQYYYDIPCVRSNGEIFFVDISSEVIRYRRYVIAVGFLRETQKIKPEITAWEEIYQHLTETIGCGVCLAYGYRIIFANQSFANILGAKSSLQVIGKEITDFISEEDIEEFRSNYENVISGIKPVLLAKRRLKKTDGSYLYTYVKVSRVMLHGKWAIQAIFIPSDMDIKNVFTAVSLDTFDNKKGISPLTKKEIEVLSLIAAGYTVKEISGKLGISVRTVTTHRCNIMHKLQIHNTAGLIKFAINNGVT
jgi:PAS domain S-box-containing protein